MRWRPGSALAVLVGVAQALTFATAVVAQSLEADVRAELERIVREYPNTAQAANAADQLQGLASPASSPLGSATRKNLATDGRRIVNGLATLAHAAVGGILKGTPSSAAKISCTGTLVACDKVLTAAHCICAPGTTAAACRRTVNAGDYSVYLQDAGVYKVKAFSLPDSYAFPIADIALLHLEKPVDGILPAQVSLKAAQAVDASGLIAGYGKTGAMRTDEGIKRDGSVLTQACPFQLDGVFCWTFNAVVTPANASNTCEGDSGGGVFFKERDGARQTYRLFGVVSGGRTASQCVNNDIALNTDLARHAVQLKAWGIRGERPTACMAQTGTRAVVLDLATNGQPNGGKVVRLSATTQSVVFDVTVAPETKSLRVAMNGGRGDGDRDIADVDLRVYRGRPFGGGGGAGSVAPECAETGPGQFAVCPIEAPEAGPWQIELRRKSGEADVQVKVTAIVR